MKLKEFLEFVNPAQRIVIEKGSLKCRYQKQNDGSHKFFDFTIENGMYENLSNSVIEDYILESEIEKTGSTLWFEDGRSADSALYIKLQYVSVDRVIRDILKLEAKDIEFHIYNKYKLVKPEDVAGNLYEQEVMLYLKGDNCYNIFINCDFKAHSGISANTNIIISNPTLPPNLSGENPHLRAACKAFDKGEK